MPGEFVESKIKYYRMRREIYAKGGCGEIHIGVSVCEFRQFLDRSENKSYRCH